MLRISQKRRLDSFTQTHANLVPLHPCVRVPGAPTPENNATVAAMEQRVGPDPNHIEKFIKRVKLSLSRRAEGPEKQSTEVQCNPVNCRKSPKYELPTNLAIDATKWMEYLPRHRRRHHMILGSFRSIGKLQEHMFTLEDVKYIVHGACQDTEILLTKKHEVQLCERLLEQQHEFKCLLDEQSFNHINSQPFTYVS